MSNAWLATAWLRLPLGKEQAEALATRTVATIGEVQPQGAANTLWAAATLGMPLSLATWRACLARIDDAISAAAGSSIRDLRQTVCNAGWAAARADRTELAAEVFALCAHAGRPDMWRGMSYLDLSQLHVVHTWLLLLHGAKSGRGLEGVLSQDQLRRGAAAVSGAPARGGAGGRREQ